MKKLLSLFSLLGLAGLLTFVTTPIYAQDVEDDVSAAETSYNDELNNEADEGWAALEVADEDVTIEGETDLDNEEDVPTIFEDDEIENLFWELDMNGWESEMTEWLIGLILGFGIIAWIIWLARIVLVIIAMWKIFEKAWEAWWKALIPIYNVYILYKIVWMKNWFWWALLVPFWLWLIAGFLPDSAANIEEILWIVGMVFSTIVAIVATFKLPRRFGWGVFTSILYVLFTSICILILGFWSYKYKWKSEVESETIVEA